MSERDELLGLVDRNDREIGTILRSQAHTLEYGGGRYLRTACALIRNSLGEFWVPRRMPHKRITPNGLDFAMAEHMGPGESYLDATIRGFNEELNLTIESPDVRLTGIIGPHPDDPYFSAIYLYESDETPDYNPDDYQDHRWMQPEKIIAEVRSGVPAKDKLVPALQLVMMEEGRL